MKAVYSGSSDYLHVAITSNKGKELYATLDVLFDSGFATVYSFHNFKLTPSYFRYYCELIVQSSYESLMSMLESVEDYFDNETFELF